MFRRLQNGHTDTSANKGGGNNKNRVFRKGPIAAVTNPLGGYKVVIWLWKNVTDNVNHKISRFHGGYTTANAPCNRSPVNSRSVGSQVKWKEIQGIDQITDLIVSRKMYIFHAFCNRSSLSTHTLEHLVGDNLINVPLTIRNRKYVIKYEYWPMKSVNGNYCFLPLYGIF